MRDELFDRDYQGGRDALNEGIDQLLAGLTQTFRTLSAIQFDAPWRPRTKRHSRSGLA